MYFTSSKKLQVHFRQQKCKFGDFWSFEHDIEGIIPTEKSEDKVKILEKVIQEKNIEIETLKGIINHAQIVQLHGGDYDNSDANTSASEDDNNSSTDDSQEDRKNILKCNVCMFETKQRNGLKIHIAKMHKTNVSSVT